MDLPQPLTEGRLVRRYKRFLADVDLDDGRRVTVHCPNPGRMLGLNAPGSRVWLTTAAAGRKLPYGLELVEADGTLVGINTNRPNKIARDAIEAGAIAELQGYACLRSEVLYGSENSRIDLLLEEPGRCWVEVKNVHYKVGDAALFPDAVTARGAKHLRELSAQVRAGDRAVMLYIVQRGDCRSFGLANTIDPTYAAGLHAAVDAGVEVLAYTCRVTTLEIVLSHAVPAILEPNI